MFSPRGNYLKNNIQKNAKAIEYTKNDLEQVNPQLHNSLSIINTKSSTDSISSTKDVVKQEITSAKTSIKQVPALFTNSNVKFGKTNIDIGGGRFDLATDYLAQRGTKNMIFDPYNRDEAYNTKTLKFLQDGNKADTATCAKGFPSRNGTTLL